jgi:pimeloyl-ACP methyl ester carboxylesterase
LLRGARRLLRSNRVWMRNTRFFALALFNQRILVLRPSRRDWGTPAHAGLHFEELRLRAGKDAIRAWWVAHEDAKATVLLFPGRAANISQELEAIRYVWSLGANVLAFDYPGFGTSDGIATEQGCHDAARAAWDALLARGIDPGSIILYGRSLGAAIAAPLAAQVGCRALVFHGCASSMADWRDHHLPKWVTKLRSVRIPLDSTKPIARARCPVVVVHAREDTLVPIQLAHRVFAAAPEPKCMIEVAGGHFDGHWLCDGALRAEWQRLIGGEGC